MLLTKCNGTTLLMAALKREDVDVLDAHLRCLETTDSSGGVQVQAVKLRVDSQNIHVAYVAWVRHTCQECDVSYVLTCRCP